jgi:hypothetical protein
MRFVFDVLFNASVVEKWGAPPPTPPKKNTIESFCYNPRSLETSGFGPHAGGVMKYKFSSFKA